MTTKDVGETSAKTIKSEPVESITYGYEEETSALELENRLLKETVEGLKTEMDKFKTPPLMVCEVREVIDDKAVVRVPNGASFFVEISQECEKINPGDTILAEQKNLCVIGKVPMSKTFDVDKFVIVEKPNTKWKDIGGLHESAEEIKEVIELPLKKPELFKEVGIKPPKGILLHGPPGTGKTLLAKAVASSTNSTFIEVVGSELVQKFIGEGAKLVKEIFQLAREKAPSIVFIDEIDALAATRVDIGTSGEREVQRTFMQLLSEIDGFKNLGNVKIIGCTNRKDILDPAVTRPGRLDRLIKIDLPDKVGREQIFDIHTRNMKLSDKVDGSEIVAMMDEFSGADVNAVCTEAGYFAIREDRREIVEEDFVSAVEKVKKAQLQEDGDEGPGVMFG